MRQSSRRDDRDAGARAFALLASTHYCDDCRGHDVPYAEAVVVARERRALRVPTWLQRARDGGGVAKDLT